MRATIDHRPQHCPRISPLRTLHLGGNSRSIVPSHVVPHADEQPAQNVDIRGRRFRNRVRQRVKFKRREQNDRRKRRRQSEKKPQRSSRNHLHARNIKQRADNHHAQRHEYAAMIFLKPGKHAREIRDEQRGINRHIENGRNQRQPCLLKSPEISHRAAHPGVVAAFKRQRARKLADHERSRQAPQERREQQDEDAFPIPGAMHDVLGAIGAARYHKEGSGDQRPQREANRFFAGTNSRCGRTKAGLLNVGWSGCSCQFLWLPPQATHSHHRVSLDFLSRLPGDRVSPGISAKLVRSCEITGIFHRCKNFFRKMKKMSVRTCTQVTVEIGFNGEAPRAE